MVLPAAFTNGKILFIHDKVGKVKKRFTRNFSNIDKPYPWDLLYFIFVGDLEQHAGEQMFA